MRQEQFDDVGVVVENNNITLRGIFSVTNKSKKETTLGVVNAILSNVLSCCFYRNNVSREHKNKCSFFKSSNDLVITPLSVLKVREMLSYIYVSQFNCSPHLKISESNKNISHFLLKYLQR